MRFGYHWTTPGRTYRTWTPMVDLAYVRVPESDIHNPFQTVRRVEDYAARHPEATVVVRLDWDHTARSYPPNPDDPAWIVGVRQLTPLYHLGGRLVVQIGNEPQLEGVDHYDHVLRSYWTAAAVVREALPDARLGSIPVATFHPDRLGAPVGCSLEGSPWADLDFALKDRMIHDQAISLAPDVDLLHVYGDGSRPVSANAASRSGQGWRWGLNVAATWQENRNALGLDTPVLITEFNTSARGTNPPHRPADNYRAGWLTEALAYVGQVLPDCEAVCWFVGSVEGRGDHWAEFAADRRYHAGSLVRDCEIQL